MRLLPEEPADALASARLLPATLAAFVLLTAAGAKAPAPSKSPMPAFKRWGSGEWHTPESGAVSEGGRG